jgi:cytochrome c oxidase assembly protein subunit 15
MIHSLLLAAMNEQSGKRVIIWLLTGCFLIFSMVVIGGITRLTGSGLSITEWKVVTGAIPPLNESQWNEAFIKYQQTPQFQKLNYDFTLANFKKIFFWEYLHRLIGRLIGVVFIVPFLYFYFTSQLDKPMLKKSLFLFLLGALQGFIGWFMVKSGLTERTSVSHYRLAIHLITAFITYGFTFWFALELIYKDLSGSRVISKNSILVRLLPVIVLLQIIYGAFVAGLHAGKFANTFPTMDGEWIPSGIFMMTPSWKNFFENPVTIQFIHRLLAILLIIFSIYIWLTTHKEQIDVKQKSAIRFLLFAITLQFFLGLFTLLTKVNIVLASLHQIGAFVLFTSVIFLFFQFKGRNGLQTN